jgi:CRP/FNR family cyclic AMP-dependent transcriptional regulator
MDTSDALAQLFEKERQFVYQRGDMIIRAGDLPSGVYYIISGWVKLYSLCRDGELNIIATLFPGEVFPLAWAVTDTLRDVNFVALGTTQVARLPKDQFVKAMQTNRAVSQAVLSALSLYSVRLTDEIDNLHYRSARERVVFRLLSLAKHFGELNKGNGHTVIKVAISNGYIARSTNMTRETVSRQLSRLSQRKLIVNMNGYIVVPDLAVLKAEAGRKPGSQTSVDQASVTSHY